MRFARGRGNRLSCVHLAFGPGTRANDDGSGRSYPFAFVPVGTERGLSVPSLALSFLTCFFVETRVFETLGLWVWVTAFRIGAFSDCFGGVHARPVGGNTLREFIGVPAERYRISKVGDEVIEQKIDEDPCKLSGFKYFMYEYIDLWWYLSPKEMDVCFH